jgi:hypothetical protein
MLTRFRSTWLAGGGAVLLAIAVSGAVAAASVLTAVTPQTTEVAPVVDTSLTFEDTNGNGIDDDCEEAVTADETAATAADAAVDLNADGTVSTSEAAQSDRSGGTNCNHGGYVSLVANEFGDCDATEPADESEGTDETDGTDATLTSVVLVTTQIQAACDEAAEETADEAAKAECEAAAGTEPAADAEETTTTVTDETTPVVTEETLDVSPNAHGKAVMKVAQDKAAIGGKNCNHGGAVSEAAHDKTALDAAKAAREAERAAAKAARDAAKDARNATHKTKSHGHAHGG